MLPNNDFASKPDLVIHNVVFYARWASRIVRIFGFRGVDNLSALSKEQTVYVCNHGPALWGILDVLSMMHIWYVQGERQKPIYMVSEDFVFDIPMVGRLAAKLGLRRPDLQTIDRILESGASLVIPAGGNFDLAKPFWLKNIPILKSIRLRGKREQAYHQSWFVKLVESKSIPIKPIAGAGTTEMTPILFVSKRLLKILGFHKFRAAQNAPGYPITLNHFVNVLIFFVFFPNAGIMGWTIFIIANIYVDILFTYPLIFRRLKSKIGDVIETDKESILGNSLRKSMAAQNQAMDSIMFALNDLLVDIELGRKDVFHYLWFYLPGRNKYFEPMLYKMQCKYLDNYEIDRERFKCLNLS